MSKRRNRDGNKGGLGRNMKRICRRRTESESCGTPPISKLQSCPQPLKTRSHETYLSQRVGVAVPILRRRWFRISTGISSWYSWVPRIKCRDISNRPRPLPSKSFPIHLSYRHSTLYSTHYWQHRKNRNPTLKKLILKFKFVVILPTRYAVVHTVIHHRQSVWQLLPNICHLFQLM
jgi:hypothetical protein